jgi:hypothetical protein
LGHSEPDIEIAVYLSCLELIQNAAKTPALAPPSRSNRSAKATNWGSPSTTAAAASTRARPPEV